MSFGKTLFDYILNDLCICQSNNFEATKNKQPPDFEDKIISFCNYCRFDTPPLNGN